MKKNDNKADRYRSFCGLGCDANADKLIVMLEQNIRDDKGPQEWHRYFVLKRAQQIKSHHDNLHFIGNQTNPLYEYFEHCQDETALQLLYKIEQECC
ncbi:N(2)-fixation sustaining protein CowN [Psychromonas antarctica]|jgi:hypothetical protein|uniref:N(2)-fixation sustaining protein CowN n=1 Tax=Psychromonas antarctica TaxID=67573 RepID=UPI001EE7C676|nr:N(2)-fixation sustaining protein CowN [Psychromonas antarctica]MCG6200834.1 N(2)-fixation sustaining protein CowN [Psychromonas antarctica]